MFVTFNRGEALVREAETIMHSALAKRHPDVFEPFDGRMATGALLDELFMAEAHCIDMEFHEFMKTLPPGAYKLIKDAAQRLEQG